MKYTKPKLKQVDLAYQVCVNGSGAYNAFGCTSGGDEGSPGACTGGGTATNGCGNGNNAAGGCLDGNSAGDNYCNDGSNVDPGVCGLGDNASAWVGDPRP